MRVASAIAAALLATAAQAQDNATAPAPTVERYSLPPGNSQATPTPTPLPSAPTPTLTPAPPPSVVPTLQIPRSMPSAIPTRAAPVARPTAAPTTASTPVPAPVTTPTASPTVTASPSPEPVATPTAPATEPAVAPVAATPASGPPSWLWWLLGFALLAVGAALAWRRFRAARAEPVAYVPEPAEAVPAPTPSPPARPVAAPVAPQPAQPLVLDFRPLQLWTRGPDAHLAFELVVTNTGAAPADAVRPVIVLASAGPDTATEIEAFNAGASRMPGGEPFDLRAGETRSVSGELTLPGDAMYVTSAADRELIVPVALVSLAWRAGLSLTRTNEAFVIGTGDATAARLGPIWVDRAGLVYAKLDARRFTPGVR